MAIQYTSSFTGSQIEEYLTKASKTDVAYATCSSAASAVEKSASISGNTNWKLQSGSLIVVKFTTDNTASNPTLNVNSTGAKSIYFKGSAVASNVLKAERVLLCYNGTQYDILIMDGYIDRAIQAAIGDAIAASY